MHYKATKKQVQGEDTKGNLLCGRFAEREVENIKAFLVWLSVCRVHKQQSRKTVRIGIVCTCVRDFLCTFYYTSSGIFQFPLSASTVFPFEHEANLLVKYIKALFEWRSWSFAAKNRKGKFIWSLPKLYTILKGTVA